MKKQNKIILAILAVLIVGFGVFVSTNSSLFQGKLAIANHNITRAEFAKMLVESAGLELTSCNVFPDVPQSAWYNGYVCTLYSNGFMDGYPDGNFRPQGLMNRAEAAKIIHTTFGVEYSCVLPKLFRDVNNTEWYFEFVNQLAAYDFFSAETAIGSNFNPANLLTTSAATKWFSKADNLR